MNNGSLGALRASAITANALNILIALNMALLLYQTWDQGDDEGLENQIICHTGHL